MFPPVEIPNIFICVVGLICVLSFFLLVKYILLSLFGKEVLVQELESKEYSFRLLAIPDDTGEGHRYYIREKGEVLFVILKHDPNWGHNMEVINVKPEETEFVISGDVPYVSIRITKKLYVEKWLFLRTPKYDIYDEHFVLYVPSISTTAEP